MKEKLFDIQTPPQNIEAEESILSAIIIDNEVFYDIQNFLQPKHFYKTAHIKIFEIMVDLLGRKEPVDLITLATELTNRKQLAEIGGATYLARLVNEVPLAVNIRQYAKYVINAFVLRKTIEASHNIIRKCFDKSEEIDVVIDYSQKQIMNVMSESFTTGNKILKIDSMIDESIDRWENLYRNPKAITGLSTGFKEIDLITCGLQKSDLIIIAARPSAGKSALMMNMGINAAKDDKKTLVFELEMAKQQLIDRIFASEAGINLIKFRSGQFEKDDWIKISEVAGELTNKPIFINDNSGLHYSDIIRESRRFYQEMGGLDLIMIDYLTLIKGDRENGRKDLEISSITKALKGLAKDLNIPIVLLSQLNRDLERRNDKRPILADLREAGSIEEDADVVIFVYRDEMYNTNLDNPNKGIAEIIFAKHRNGPTGKIKLQWSGQIATFHNLYTGEQ